MQGECKDLPGFVQRQPWGDLTPEAVDTGIAAVRQIAKILRLVQGYHKEIGDIEGIYGLSICQQARIDELETTVTSLAFRRD